MVTDIHELLEKVTENPGVYLMKNAAGTILYIGKAANLKKRLTSYFRNSNQLDIKTERMIRQIASIDTIVTASEQDAFILESNLVKQHKPRYNVILKDDKRYPSLRLDIKNSFPNLLVVRKPEKDGALYFGPYSSPHAVRETLKIIHKTFKLRKCKSKIVKERVRPCLNYQIGRCMAPCAHLVTPEEYSSIVKEVTLFLKGRAPELLKSIRTEMMKASDNQDYEKAITLRDQLFSIEKTLEKKLVVMTDFKDRDVFAAIRQDNMTVVTVMIVRNGYLQNVLNFNFKETLSTDEEILTSFIRQYYEKNDDVPEEILISHSLADFQILLEWFKSIKGEKPTILNPQKGEKLLLVKMAIQNAEKSITELLHDDRKYQELLEKLQYQLKLKQLPIRIECFDNSTLQGSNSVAGMVVFQKGKPDKSSYRKFRIRTVSEPDDYAAMEEVISRRFNHPDDPIPNLLIIDGGKGQLNVVVSVLKKLNLDSTIDVVGIAKKNEEKGETEDKLYKPDRINPIVLKDKKLMLFLESIRNEAHRFAISYHRKRQRHEVLQSELDTIPGIGSKRKKILLSHFGSIENIRAATIDQLSMLPGMNRKIATAVLRSINPSFSESL